jgi:glutamine amidotransferase
MSPPAPTIAIVDYGMGNRRSVEKAFERIGAHTLLTGDHDAIRAADGVVVPGVGAFRRAMESLRALGLDEVVRGRAEAGVPVLGICLGMQLLFESSTELGGAEGLGLVPGEVSGLETGGRSLPHMGWNRVDFARESPLLEGLGDAAAFYHANSFAPRPEDPGVVLGTAEYGEPFVSIVERGPVRGVQFHPEKSSTAGLRLLANFAALCVRAPA